MANGTFKTQMRPPVLQDILKERVRLLGAIGQTDVAARISLTPVPCRR